MRIGELLVRRGHLNDLQVREILQEQSRGGAPFGAIAERLFGLGEIDIEMVWAEQYEMLVPTLPASGLRPTADALAIMDRRQAWQFRMLPIRREGAEYMVATVREALPRALRFAMAHVTSPVYFVLAEPNDLGEALMQHYPINGLTPESVDGRRPRWKELRNDVA
jgi:hypothetical protein